MPGRFEAGRVCLELADEALDRVEGLVVFLRGAGVVPAGARLAGVDRRWLGPFRELRDCIAELVGAQLAGRPARPAALELLNALAAAAPPAPRAVRTRSGLLVRTLGGEPDCRALLAAVARDAVELLTDPATRALLRRCEGPGCRRCYLDTSRGRRRRWCSSEECGNRARVARHRAAHPRAGLSGPDPKDTAQA
ncbi:ABATE domain-containing protein [Streptomyces sp. SKN60]|uniref:ABATE domain-containing protein n=1 Tax=Streptomyces sp. SKN60 TaxID=2855506 RepID=UPI002246DB8C|nr:ABATE domain-containing protein [Streptomyces sp. SKN60]MCX2184851.1 ABATE domain-containing protein [Streptomyces sp. SKN60]